MEEGKGNILKTEVKYLNHFIFFFGHYAKTTTI